MQIPLINQVAPDRIKLLACPVAFKTFLHKSTQAHPNVYTHQQLVLSAVDNSNEVPGMEDVGGQRNLPWLQLIQLKASSSCALAG